MIYLQLLIVLACIFIGVRMGGIGLGVMGGIGLMLLTFGLGLRLDFMKDAPIDVILIIVSVITATATLQATKGLDYMVQVAEGMLRSNPKNITIVAPLVGWLFTFLAGTGFVALAVMPIVAEVAEKTGIRPERPMAGITVASQGAIMASPISAATAALVGILEPAGVSLTDVLMISIPATLTGSLLCALVMMKFGVELDQDPIYQERLKSGQLVAHKGGEREVLPSNAKTSVYVFLLGVVTIVLLALSVKGNMGIVPLNADGKTANMANVIQVVMLIVAAINIGFIGADVNKTVQGTMFRSGAVAAVSILGVAWMSSCFVNSNIEVFKSGLLDMVQGNPGLFVVAIFGIAIITFSQGATTKVMMPLGVSLGIPAPSLIAMFPAVNGVWFIPSYPSSIAAIEFDRTGTTGIGKFLFNHSFMLGGIVNTFGAVIVGFALASILL